MSIRRSCYGLGVLLAAQALGACNNAALAPSTPFNSAQQGARNASIRTAGSDALLYVSDPGTNIVTMYSYPGLKPRGTLLGLRRPSALCVDASSGNVWVVWGTQRSRFTEFAHGSTARIRTLTIQGDPQFDGCAVDPTTGNLAVTHTHNFDDAGYIAIFKNGSGKPMGYEGPIWDPAFIGYDEAGDAFADGAYAGLEELKSGAKRATNDTPKGLRLHSAGGVQYDGSHIAVGAAKRGIIYQTLDRKITGTTTLSGACFVQQFFIDGSVVIAPNICSSSGDVLFYDYPAGGEPIRKLGGFSRPYAVVISP
jgi:hypothetical protein